MKTVFLFPFLVLLLVSCSTIVDTEATFSFESTYLANGNNVDLVGNITYELTNETFFFFRVETDCEDVKSCPTTDIFTLHDFEENSRLTKNYDTDTASLTEVLLFPNGKCSVPFSPSNGTIQLAMDVNGTITGEFDVILTQSNGYDPDPEIGCPEKSYSSDGSKTISYTGNFEADQKNE